MRRLVQVPGLGTDPGRWRVAFFIIGTAYLAFLFVEKLAIVISGFSTILIVVFLAWLLAFVLSPLVGLLEEWLGWSRGVASGVVFAGTLVGGGLGLFVLGTLVGSQIGQLTGEFPQTRTRIEATLTGWQDAIHIGRFQPDLIALFNDGVAQVQRTFTSALGNAPGIGVAVVGNLVIILILSLYMVLDSQKILRGINRLIPDRYDDEADLLERSVARAFGGFLRAQVILAGIQALLVLALGIVIGLPYLFLIVAVSSVFMLVPFFGPPLALVPPLVATAIYQPSWILIAAPVLLVVQTVVVNWLQPRLMHGALGLHPLLVLIGLLVGAQVAGVWGALFGIPVIAVINTFVTYIVNLAVLHDTAEVEADQMLEEARREAPDDAPMEEIVALAADKAEEAHEEARAEEAGENLGDAQLAAARAQTEAAERLVDTTDELRATSRVTRDAALETRDAAAETRDAAAEIRDVAETIRDDEPRDADAPA
jgi:predicted PurR-regulated permease PerM